jgi:hypothetical protein
MDATVAGNETPERTVAASFLVPADAERAIGALLDHGITAEQVSVASAGRAWENDDTEEVQPWDLRPAHADLRPGTRLRRDPVRRSAHARRHERRHRSAPRGQFRDLAPRLPHRRAG